MDDEAHRMLVLILDRRQTVQRTEEVTAFFGIMDHRVGYDTVRKASRKILVVPAGLDGLRVDGVGLDLVRPVGPVDDTSRAQHRIHLFLSFLSQMIVRYLGNDTMPFLAP